MSVFNTEIFASTMKKLYLEQLKNEMKACLENVMDNIEEVLESFEEGLYKAEEHIIIQGDVKNFFRLRAEYDQVLTHDHVEWWEAMRDDLEYDEEAETWKPKEGRGLDGE